MRICYVTEKAVANDGWGRYATELVRSIRACGGEPVLVTASQLLEPSLAGIEQHVLLPPLFKRHSFQSLSGLLRTNRIRRVFASCDVVHCLVELYAPLVACSRPKRVLSVLTAHGKWAIEPLRSPRQRWLFAPSFRSMDLVLFQSEFTQRRVLERIQLRRCAVAPGGVDVDLFSRPSGHLLPEWLEGDPVVLSVAALKPRKGHHVALEAFAIARRRCPKLRYAIIGAFDEESRYVDRLRKRAAELGVSDGLHLVGMTPLEELTAWYKRAAVFLLLPEDDGAGVEGLGLVYLEAAAAGVPVVGTLHGGVSEAVEAGVTGLLVPPGEPAAAAEAMEKLLSDEVLRRRMGKAAQERALTFSWSNLAGKVMGLYLDLIKERRVSVLPRLTG